MTALTASAVSLSDRDRLALLAAEHAALVTAARASVAAAALGQIDPLVFLRAQLAKHGQLPPVGARPLEVLAMTVVARRAQEVAAR
jgi:hypothetical protein